MVNPDIDGFTKTLNHRKILRKTENRNFQSYGTVNKRSKKSEMPCSGRKLSARSADNVEASRVSVGRSSLIV